MTRTPFFVVAALAASACTSPTERAVEQRGVVSSSIVGGEDDDADPAVVAIVNETLGLTLCSGTLVGPRTVLTAGHCNFTSITARFGANAATPDRKIAVVTTVVHPKYTTAGSPWDFALLELETPVTDIAPLTLRTTPLGEADVGKTTIRHVGFGVSNEDAGTGVGRKRTVSYPVTKVTDVLVYSGAPGKQTCDNDSGAPGLIRDPDGVERIAGVVSDGPSCHEDGWDGRADLADLASFVTSTRSAWETPQDDAGNSGDPGMTSGGMTSGGCALVRAEPRSRASSWPLAVLALAFAVTCGRGLSRRRRLAPRGLGAPPASSARSPSRPR